MVFAVSCSSTRVPRTTSPTYAPGDIVVEIMASPANYITTFGHAYFCVGHILSSGIKEDCYGFYPDPSSDAVFVGGSNLADQFKEDPTRMANVSWSFKKKITQKQLQDLGRFIAAADTIPYKYTKYNCGDLVHDLVASLGWRNVTKGVLPEPYVRNLYAANIERFGYKVNRDDRVLQRSGSDWLQQRRDGTNRTNTYIDRGNDDTYIFMDDGAKGVIEIRAQLKGNAAQERHYRRGNWIPYVQGPVIPEFD